MQFDLATIPLGSPIIYADLTLTGLDGQWLAPDGRWRAEVLASWIDDDWLNRNFHWLSRADSGVASLDNEVSSADIGQGRFNTFSLPPAGIAELQARLFKSKIAFRLVGPSSGTDNLFAWDSGFGARSTGRAPVLRIVTSGPAPAEPPPSPTPYYIVITLTPTDDNSILMQAAARLTATALATPGEVAGTPEPTATTELGNTGDCDQYTGAGKSSDSRLGSTNCHSPGNRTWDGNRHTAECVDSDRHTTAAPAHRHADDCLF
jgi:hypothetical protein